MRAVLSTSPRSAAFPVAALPLTVAAIFLSAALLFSVQPMFTKLVLPVLGGSPSVWSVATVFFQALLLLGYLYAHLLARYCGPGLALVVHLSVLTLAAMSLPIALPAAASVPGNGQHTLWLLGLFTAVVGLPFFALSANGPLLQSIYARTTLPSAGNPYFLYAASNIGSFAALIAYPLLIEPFLALRTQTATWAGGFVVLWVLIAAGGVGMLRQIGAQATPIIAREPAGEDGLWKDRLAWIGLSLVPSGLLVSVTAHISTDIAAVPLLWVAPLALYLLTFVLAFSGRSLVSGRWLVRIQVALVALALLTLVVKLPLPAALALHLAAFFASALLAHRTLYARRPSPTRLTEFYLLMSFGGCLGGVFSALVAPVLFSSVLEYPILLVLALCCRTEMFSGGLRLWLVDGGRAALGLAAMLLGAILVSVQMPAGLAQLLLSGLLALVLVTSSSAPRQVLAIGVALGLVACVLPLGSGTTETRRSFFGVHKLAVSADGRLRTLSHGNTIHGATLLLDAEDRPVSGRPEPLTYYTFEGGIGSAIAAVRAARGGSFGAVSVIGLGAGSLACHAAAGERWSFYEIDPVVVDIARDPRAFRFLSACTPEAPVILGDARLTYGRAGEKTDLLVVDAFSSDSIPAHLVTAEAFALYRESLVPNGALIVHITNRNLDLARILARAGAEAGLVTYVLDERLEEPFELRFRASTKVVAMARHPDDLGVIARGEVWRRLDPDMARAPWTDDFSNVVEAMLDKAFPGRP